jgi:dephospho-CoA kinase
VNYTKKIIGLTGLYCSGKTTCEKILQSEYGFHIIDVDKIGHLALTEKKNEIITKFGSLILTEDQIDRKKLGTIVFKDRNKLKLLNSIVHPWMSSKVEEEINSTQSTRICINAALLFEMGLHSLCEKIIITKANIFETIKRAKKRDGYSFIKILRIINSQNVLKYAKKNYRNTEIYYIDNSHNSNILKKQIDNIVMTVI